MSFFSGHRANIIFAVPYVFAVRPINGSRQTIWHTANVLFPVVLPGMGGDWEEARRQICTLAMGAAYGLQIWLAS